ncbi:MAG: hypothetical protein Q4D89_00170 [Arachnia propionica]|uniref:hypothetical protein n=1 Tax=Arachnia propionica TaxID=1750 RepID=UPI0027030908|nr:hypothetical protein [Arachnia propionica]
MTTPHVRTAPRTASWAALLLAGVFEIGYALSVNGSRGFTDWSAIGFVDSDENHV